MLIKINQAIKGAGSFTWHVLIPDEGDIRKHFYGSVKKRTSSGKSKKRRRENYDYSASWALLSKQIVGSYQQNFCDGNIFDKICSISTATAKKVSNAFISLFFYLLEWFYPISFDENSALFYYYCFFFHMRNEL